MNIPPGYRITARSSNVIALHHHTELVDEWRNRVDADAVIEAIKEHNLRPITRPCERCGKRFPKMGNLKRYCSRPCQLAAYRRR